MSDLAPGDLSYQFLVAEYFLGLTGKGLMLSPLDQELIADWERRGLPVEVVCRGLRFGLEEHALRRPTGASPPRSLRALRFSVEDEWRAFTSRAVGDAPPPPAGETAAAEARLGAARRRLSELATTAAPAWRAGYREALAALDAAASPPPFAPATATASATSIAPVSASSPATAPASAPSPASATSSAPGSPPAPAPSLAQVEAAIAAADASLLAAWLASLDRPRRAALGPRLALRAGPRPRGASRLAHREALRHHLLEAARAAGLTCLRGSV